MLVVGYECWMSTISVLLKSHGDCGVNPVPKLHPMADMAVYQRRRRTSLVGGETADAGKERRCWTIVDVGSLRGLKEN
jgi:hypothetical protein